jgi:hypothetical protein
MSGWCSERRPVYWLSPRPSARPQQASAGRTPQTPGINTSITVILCLCPAWPVQAGPGQALLGLAACRGGWTGRSRLPGGVAPTIYTCSAITSPRHFKSSLPILAGCHCKPAADPLPHSGESCGLPHACARWQSPSASLCSCLHSWGASPRDDGLTNGPPACPPQDRQPRNHVPCYHRDDPGPAGRCACVLGCSPGRAPLLLTRQPCVRASASTAAAGCPPQGCTSALALWPAHCGHPAASSAGA